jgi:hypothetical protein
MNIETETMKQWAESVSKAHDLLVWGHHLRVKEILQEVRDNIRIAVEEADATPPAAQTVTCNGMPAYEGSLSAAQRKPLTNEQIVQKAKVIGGLFDDLAVEYQTDDIIKFGREMEAAHNIKE